jgi:indole-3-acetate monooxygenase
LLCESPQVQDAVGRADAILNAGHAYRTAMITELRNTVVTGNETTLEQRRLRRLSGADYTIFSAQSPLRSKRPV